MMLRPQLSRGVIVTFYSYKGGTGRSMALANYACYLAQRPELLEKRILVIDWDLEAPGLHRYFPISSDVPRGEGPKGVIDYFMDLLKAFTEDDDLYTSLLGPKSLTSFNAINPLENYLLPEVFKSSAVVDLMRAGIFGPKFAENVGSFRWIEFFTAYPHVFRLFRELVETRYAYTLIDSRTGLTDTSGICTMVMPEKLVAVFTPNLQSLHGVVDLLKESFAYRASSDDFRPLGVFPLPSRIENVQKLQEQWRERYQTAFERLFSNDTDHEHPDLTDYFNHVLLPHKSDYAFGEMIAITEEKFSENGSLRKAYEEFFEILSNCDVAWERIELDALYNTSPANGEHPLSFSVEGSSQTNRLREDDGTHSAACPRRFLVALSFPAEYRGRVERIADTLAITLGRDKVLYDRWYAAEFARPNLDTYLSNLYRDEVELIVLFLTRQYRSHDWCGLELSASRSLLRNDSNRLMFLCLDDADIQGLYSIDGFLDIREISDSDVAATILTRLGTSASIPQPSSTWHVNYLPLRPPIFVGREEELSGLRDRLRQPGALVPIVGLAGKGKTSLALEFAHRYQQDFEKVLWLPCQSSSLVSIAAELARLLGLKLEGDLPEIVRELKGVCGSQRCLLILDNVEDESPGEMIPGGAASVLVTTRLSSLRFLRFHQPLPLPLFTDEQCFELFRRQIGAEEVARHEPDCRRLFQHLGHLPMAVSISAALIREDVRYTIGGLACNLPGDVTALIRESIEALAPEPRQLLVAMSACAPEEFHLDLAAEIAGLIEAKALAALEQLMARSLTDEVDRTDRRYRLNAMVRESVDHVALRPRHAEVVRLRFENWEVNWRRCEQELPDFQLALKWALKNNDGSLAQGLAYCGYLLTTRVGRLTEALEFCQQMIQVADDQKNTGALQVWLGNEALILQGWGRSEEALALHKKQEAICLELGNRDGLQTSYGNQALILKAWGRFDEALALHKKEEEICLQLGAKDGLQACYGNQALILKAWGRLEEALALHKTQEAICLELGNNDGLQACYGNQALILKAWGRLEDALALLKKQETICSQLGNKDNLQISYGNQALILKAWGRLDEALALHKKEEAICLELGNKDGLQISYGNQALILNTWGRLEEALALIKKQETICVELGNKIGLAYCSWNWGLLARARGNSSDEQAKLSAALTLFRELGMPRESESVEAELAKSRSDRHF